MSSTEERDYNDYDGKDNANNHDGNHPDDDTGNEAGTTILAASGHHQMLSALFLASLQW